MQNARVQKDGREKAPPLIFVFYECAVFSLKKVQRVCPWTQRYVNVNRREASPRQGCAERDDLQKGEDDAWGQREASPDRLPPVQGKEGRFMFIAV